MKSQQLKELAALSDGYYDLNLSRPWWQFMMPRERGGWLQVWRSEKGNTDMMWCTHKDHHDGLSERAQALTIKPDGTLVCYMKSALSMWIQWGYGYGGDKELAEALSLANWLHSRLCATNTEQKETS